MKLKCFMPGIPINDIIRFLTKMNRATLSLAYCLLIYAQLNDVVGFNCNSDNCRDCASNTDAFGVTCRWCRRDNECHTPGAILTNPCKRVENIVDPSLCDTKLSQYDPELSLKMLLLSAVAYDPVHPQECLDNSLPSAKFQLQTVATKKCDFADNECSGYVAVSHALEVIVIAFRGSENFGQAFVQFVQTLIYPKEAFLSEGEVQIYWKRGFETLWPCIEADLKALIAGNPSYQIWVTGHSLGGAMASLASAWLSYNNVTSRKKIISYTFGMPRVGNYDYALEHDQLVSNSWRVVNDDDAVPHFPSVASLSVVNGPYHHGVETFYSEPATSVYSKHRECHGKPNNEDITCSFSEIKRSFERHKNYFNIPVGTFWKEKCVDSSRGEPELPSNTPPSNFQLMKDRCLKYEYKNGSDLKAPDRSKSSIHKQSAFSFLLIYICGALK